VRWLLHPCQKLPISQGREGFSMRLLAFGRPIMDGLKTIKGEIQYLRELLAFDSRLSLASSTESEGRRA
jgi:hypothetical protein